MWSSEELGLIASAMTSAERLHLNVTRAWVCLFFCHRPWTAACVDTETKITLAWVEGDWGRGLGLVGLGWLPPVAFAAQLMFMLMCSKVFSILRLSVRAIVTSGLNQFHAGKAPRAESQASGWAEPSRRSWGVGGAPWRRWSLWSRPLALAKCA